MKLNVGVVESAMVKNIISIVCGYYGLTEEELASKRRTHNLVHARQLCCYLIRKYTKVSKLVIGKVFFNRDHSTVIHSINVIESELTNSARGTRSDVKNLCDLIEGKTPKFHSKVESRFAIQIKCSGMKDEFFGFWDDAAQANNAFQNRIKAIVGKRRCLRSSVIKINLIQNA